MGSCRSPGEPGRYPHFGKERCWGRRSQQCPGDRTHHSCRTEHVRSGYRKQYLLCPPPFLQGLVTCTKALTRRKPVLGLSDSHLQFPAGESHPPASLQDCRRQKAKVSRSRNSRRSVPLQQQTVRAQGAGCTFASHTPQAHVLLLLISGWPFCGTPVPTVFSCPGVVSVFFPPGLLPTVTPQLPLPLARVHLSHTCYLMLWSQQPF